MWKVPVIQNFGSMPCNFKVKFRISVFKSAKRPMLLSFYASWRQHYVSLQPKFMKKEKEFSIFHSVVLSFY